MNRRNRITFKNAFIFFADEHLWRVYDARNASVKLRRRPNWTNGIGSHHLGNAIPFLKESDGTYLTWIGTTSTVFAIFVVDTTSFEDLMMSLWRRKNVGSCGKLDSVKLIDTELVALGVFRNRQSCVFIVNGWCQNKHTHKLLGHYFSYHQTSQKNEQDHLSTVWAGEEIETGETEIDR